MKYSRFLAAAILSSAALAQTAAREEAAHQGQSWVGLLVSASCATGAAPGQTAADREAKATVTNRTTTPAVDDAGTRGSAMSGGKRAVRHKTASPATGDIMGRSTSPTDSDWATARKQAESLAAGCSLEPDTKQFALVLADGAMLQFDELANQAIVKQRPKAAGANRGKLYRVSVEGKLQNGKIALTSIRM